MAQLIVGITLLLLTLALRAASVNRYIRSKLLISCWLFAAHAGVAAMLRYAPLPPDIVRQVGIVHPLLLAFGVVSLFVALLINPWRVDRIPDQFPRIVQDAIVIALFAIAATLVLRERILATTAVGAVILGLALQETLSNLFAGLAIQIEKPFRIGHWVTIGGQNGLVSEITWRATKIRTKAGNFVIVPNSVLARDTITNYSEPTLETRVELEVGAGYETPPNEVKAAIREAIRDESLIVRAREPEIIVADFGASAIVYRVRVWTTDFAADERIRDGIRSQIYYAFRRLGINIPYPIQVQIEQESCCGRDGRRFGAGARRGRDLRVAQRRAARRAGGGLAPGAVRRRRSHRPPGRRRELDVRDVERRGDRDAPRNGRRSRQDPAGRFFW